MALPLVATALTAARTAWTAAKATKVGAALIGTPARALLTGLGLGQFLGSNSNAAQQVNQYRQ